MSGLRVCQVTSVHDATDGRVFERISTSLAKKYDVTLIAPNVQDYEQNGVHVKGVELPLDRFKRQKCLNRVYSKMIEVDADVYHFHDPELMRLGLKIKKKGKKVIFDSHENIPLQIRTKPYIPKYLRGTASKLYELYEKYVFKRYDAIVSVTPDIVNRIKIINPHTYLLTNYPVFIDKSDHRAWERRIGFAGLITSNWKLEEVLEAIKDIDVVFELAGPVSGDYLDILKKHPSWTKVNYHGVIKHNEVFEMLLKCTVGIAVASDNNTNMNKKQGSIGVTKMFEYMMIGIPVIATDLVNWRTIIEGNECGICVDCNDSRQIGTQISFLLDHPEESKLMGDNGMRAVKREYCWQSQEETLFTMYSSL